MKELEEKSGKTITNLHKPDIDDVTILCSKCGKEVHRVPEVLDSWIEAGSASFAERHYPFNTEWKLEDFYPPDYIAEYTGQIRAWFYVLHVIGAALYKKQAFKNVSVTGVIQGTDGKKMSKNLKNYPDPKEMIEKYGGDALRLYLLGSPVMHGEDILISEEQYRNQVRGMLLILWNTYNFFILNANADGWETKNDMHLLSKNVLDEWITALLNNVIKEVTDALERYDTVIAIDLLKSFVDNFSTWYVRRSRDRVGPSATDNEDKNAFYTTSHAVLTTLCQLLAPLAPFMSEEIYRNLTSEESVHLTNWPTIENQKNETKLIEDMHVVRKIVELGLGQRKEKQIKVRQPLAALRMQGLENTLDPKLVQLIKDELNVKEVVFGKAEGDMSGQLDTKLTSELLAEGKAREIIRSIQEKRKELGTTLTEKVAVIVPEFPEAFEDYIKKSALVDSITIGEVFEVKRIQLF